ncbi:MAG TPA: PilZ domain-containing protein [Terriglobales bacterium]|nr:PilZ domain-containing protein [Terriglobales bacterium]
MKPDLHSQERDGTVVSGHPEHRRHARHHLATPLNLWRRAGTGTMIPGIALEISESGISVILPERLSVGENVEFTLQLPGGELRAAAVVRNTAMFRHGFEFAFLSSAQRQLIKQACASLPLYTPTKY